jgi:beta-lactam-binding protein with PASTA domain
MVPVPAVACTAVGDAQSELKNAGFTPVTGGQVASNCPPGTVADTRPSGMASKNTAIVMEISKGPGGGGNPPNPGNGGKKRGPGH